MLVYGYCVLIITALVCVNLNALIKTVRLSCFVCFIINIMNYLELICNIDNFAVGEMAAGGLRLPNEKGTGENPGQYPLL